MTSMARSTTFESDFEPDDIFDGGNMDCGSGLSLLIRQRMLALPAGAILEIRSTEPTVTTELPPWCRLAGHQHLGSTEVEYGHWRHWIRCGTPDPANAETLESDKAIARDFSWSVRARHSNSGPLKVYSRNLSWASDGSASFDRKAEEVTAFEQFNGSIVADLVACFVRDCQRNSLAIDEFEATLNTRLHNPLAAMGIESGDPGVESIKLVAYVTSPAKSNNVRDAWERALECSPVLNTMKKACEVETRLVLM